MKNISTNNSLRSLSISYKDAGVDIDAGSALVERIKGVAQRTHRLEIMTGLGGFGALCELPTGYKKPILVSGSDGVGTKLRLAMDLSKHNTIGIDLVAMCVNDLIVLGAEPLFFLDYYATNKLNVDIAEEVINGIGEGCLRSGCALVGGETAEMPGMYNGDDYDLAGFCVGVVEKDNIIDSSKVSPGDVLIGMASSGPHANGYSLIRKILEINGLSANNSGLNQEIEGKSLEEALMVPTRIYAKPLLALIEQIPIHALSHITGGGLLENVTRVLPKNTRAVIETDSWDIPSIFKWLKKMGNIKQVEMYRTFNCGIGMVICVDKNKQAQAIDFLSKMGEIAWVIGHNESSLGNAAAVVLV